MGIAKNFSMSSVKFSIFCSHHHMIFTTVHASMLNCMLAAVKNKLASDTSMIMLNFYLIIFIIASSVCEIQWKLTPTQLIYIGWIKNILTNHESFINTLRNISEPNVSSTK